MISLNRSALGVLSFASAKESTKGKQPGGPFLLKGPPRLLQRGGAFSLEHENAWTHKVTFEDPPTRALTRTTAGLLHVWAVLRFWLSVTFFGRMVAHGAPFNGLTDRRDIAVDVWF